MTREFEDPNDFDRYALEKGKWAYDNGWRYKEEYFGAAYVGEEFGKTALGESNYLLMLREGNTPHRTLILHVIGSQFMEVWIGQVEAKDEFDQMMVGVNEYIEQYRAMNV